MIVGLAGDWHGHAQWARARIRDLAEQGVDTLLHLGDFGIFPGPSGKKYLREVEASCAHHQVTIYATPGNHEDWGRLLSKKPEQRNHLGALLWLTDHVAVFPRDPAGHRFVLGDRSFVSLGGAPSLDAATRTEGTSWWPEEMIPTETAERVAADGYADIMLTHDAPGAPFQTPGVAHICENNDWGWSDRALAYAAVGRDRLTTAFLGVQPRVLVHGHYHVRSEAIVDLPDRDHPCQVISLDCNGRPGNMTRLNLDTLEQT